MEQPTVPVIGMAWYNPEDYEVIRRIMADGYSFPACFERWQKKAEHRERRLRRKGYAVLRVPLLPEAFCDWCRPRGLKRDHLARILFASLAVDRSGLLA